MNDDDRVSLSKGAGETPPAPAPACVADAAGDAIGALERRFPACEYVDIA